MLSYNTNEMDGLSGQIERISLFDIEEIVSATAPGDPPDDITSTNVTGLSTSQIVRYFFPSMSCEGVMTSTFFFSM
jgi:hypothetical protein